MAIKSPVPVKWSSDRSVSYKVAGESSTQCPQKVSQRFFFAVTSKVVHKFPSNLACSYSSEWV